MAMLSAYLSGAAVQRQTPLWLLCLCAVAANAAEPPATAPLRVPHIADAPPFMLTNPQQMPVGGILFDLYQLLAGAVQRPLHIEAIPRKRVTDLLLRGELDLYCNGTPEWFVEPALRWSPPLFVHRDLYISATPYKDFADFSRRSQGKTGTTFGYVYPTLAPLFASGQLQRVDSYSPAESLRHLQKKNLSAVVVSELEFAYLQADKSGLYPVEVERNDIQCMYSPALSAELVAALDAAIVALRQQGQISQILARYR